MGRWLAAAALLLVLMGVLWAPPARAAPVGAEGEEKAATCPETARAVSAPHTRQRCVCEVDTPECVGAHCVTGHMVNDTHAVHGFLLQLCPDCTCVPATATGQGEAAAVHTVAFDHLLRVPDNAFNHSAVFLAREDVAGFVDKTKLDKKQLLKSTNSQTSGGELDLAMAAMNRKAVTHHRRFAMDIGLGNVLCAAGFVVEVAAKMGRLPAVPCQGFLGNYDRLFWRFHCLQKGTATTAVTMKQTYGKWSANKSITEASVISVADTLVGNEFMEVFGPADSTGQRDYGYWPEYCSAFRLHPSQQDLAMQKWEEVYTEHNLNRSLVPVAIHLRRGDKVTDRAAWSIHGNLAEQTLYYQRSVQHMILEFAKLSPHWKDKVVFIVFTDDPVWAENLFATFPQGAHVAVVQPKPRSLAEDVYIDLYMLSLADFLVMANSSFSFLAQVLMNCRLHMPGWWSSGLPTLPSDFKDRLPERIATFPSPWQPGEIVGRKKSRPMDLSRSPAVPITSWECHPNEARQNFRSADPGQLFQPGGAGQS